ncbi:MAG: HlyD family secretion protein [Hydrocarboniphaga sp.]|uniref:HlyD family secretion protein n=1 Tax=Hydrocarboniphaga sp. TaxID=2033016 RepID=UPI0026092D3C|nr:HlyD family secretion protein [Hydrocarboniphaga sp.]MDB5972993.1 HlyD family secretion protein [Hydrocarboniphaga sp.]
MNEEPAANSKRSRLWLVAGLAVLVLIAALMWWRSRNIESTDDAYIQADITMIASRVPGTVIAVHVADNQSVKAGAALFEIDPADYETHVRQAEANLAVARAQAQSAEADLTITRTSAPAGVAQARAGLRAAQAQAERAKADVARYESLYKKDEISKQTLDQATSTARALQAQAEQAVALLDGAQTTPQQTAAKQAMVASAQAAVAQAQAALDQARLQLSYTRVVAPADGLVTHKNLQLGSQVQAGAPVLALVGNAPWIVANFKETQLQHMRAGQDVKVKIDAYPAHDFHARVDSVQAGTGSAFSLLPPENASGNFVKVVQRVPVKLVFDPLPDAALHLVPGMSAVTRVDVSTSRGAPAVAAR